MIIPDPRIWLEPARGSYLGREALTLPGIERMRLLADRDGPRPPICHLIGLAVVEVGPGLTTCVTPATGWLLAATGGFSGGVMALAADAALGGALTTVLESGQLLTTSELSMSYLRPARADAGNLIARGRLVHAARSLGLSDVFIENSQGRLLAHGSSRCVFVPAPREYDVPRPERRAPSSLDPWMRPPAGQCVEASFSSRDYPEMFDDWARGALPAPPVSHLTGVRPTAHGPGHMTFELPASEWLNNAFGVLYGGAVAYLADSAIAGAIWMTMERGQVLASLNLHVYFLRPAFADGRPLTSEGTIAHAGKSLRVAGAIVRNADGKVVATATGSAKVVSDRPASLA